MLIVAEALAQVQESSSKVDTSNLHSDIPILQSPTPTPTSMTTTLDNTSELMAQAELGNFNVPKLSETFYL